MNEDIVAYLRRMISEERAAHIEELARGQATDFGTYKFICGKIAGVNLVANKIEDLAHRIQEDERE